MLSNGFTQMPIPVGNQPENQMEVSSKIPFHSFMPSNIQLEPLKSKPTNDVLNLRLERRDNLKNKVEKFNSQNFSRNQIGGGGHEFQTYKYLCQNLKAKDGEDGFGMDFWTVRAYSVKERLIELRVLGWNWKEAGE